MVANNSPNPKLTAIGDKNLVWPVAKNIKGDIPKKVVTDVSIIGLALTSHDWMTASTFDNPFSRNFFKKSIKISESFTTIPTRARSPITDKNCKLYPKNRWPSITPTTAKGIENKTIKGSNKVLNKNVNIKNIIAREIYAAFFIFAKFSLLLFFCPR